MNEKNLQFIYEEKLDPSHEALLFEGIDSNATKTKGQRRSRTFGIFVKDPSGKIVGGISGATLYGSLYIDMLWVEEGFRNKKLGTKLMQEAEKFGRDQGCTFATLNTMDWEGLLFYQKLGYELEFVREGYEKNSKMYFLKKSL